MIAIEICYYTSSNAIRAFLIRVGVSVEYRGNTVFTRSTGIKSMANDRGTVIPHDRPVQKDGFRRARRIRLARRICWFRRHINLTASSRMLCH